MGRRQWTILIGLAVVAAVAIAVFALGGDDESPPSGGPRIVTASELSDFAAESGDRVYWLGEREGARYELTETSKGRVYLRYLRGDAEAGDERSDFVTVATYPARNGIAELRRAARGAGGSELGRTDDGATLLIDPSSPGSAHLAYPGGDVQIEVYGPVPGQALRLASRGDVQQVP